ncbi:MAG: TGS domain-containing protein [Candidatus Aenigmarchaeota archaeon]|nr:TGS domain-containing protein [Candidatus Aenigmarchaeota archaeon]
MPTNLPKEYFLIEKDYSRAKTLDEKIELLKKLISSVPKHKGTEHLLADLRKRLSKLKDELEVRSRKSSSAKKEAVRKSGDILVSILGLTQSGKSTLLKRLTNASVDIGSQPYTTKELATGVCFFEGVNVQFVEIPSFFRKKDMNIAHTSDLLLILDKNPNDAENIEQFLKENKLQNKRKIFYSNFRSDNELLKNVIIQSDFIRVFTKPVGREVGKKAIVLRKGSSIKDLVKKINEHWLEGFKFARIFDNTKFSGRQVGLEYTLKDKDTVEIHMM